MSKGARLNAATFRTAALRGSAAKVPALVRLVFVAPATPAQAFSVDRLRLAAVLACLSALVLAVSACASTSKPPSSGTVSSMGAMGDSISRAFDACVSPPGQVDKYQTVPFDGNRYSVPRHWASGS